MAKLTKPQIELLNEVVTVGRSNCFSEYPPRRKLVALGYATEHEGRMGGSWITPTAEGKAAHHDLVLAGKVSDQ